MVHTANVVQIGDMEIIGRCAPNLQLVLLPLVSERLLLIPHARSTQTIPSALFFRHTAAGATAAASNVNATTHSTKHTHHKQNGTNLIGDEPQVHGFEAAPEGTVD